MKNKNQRQQEAEIRNSEYSQLTTPQKVTSLDLRLGGNVGAIKQRAKLFFQIEKEKRQPPEEAKVIKDKKAYQKPKRS